MGREIRRVPVDFDWPLNKTWEGFLMPDRFDEEKCPDCKNGYSPQAQNLYDLWYGKLPFDPASTGSTPFRGSHPAIEARAQRNIDSAPEYYGTGPFAVSREANRLAALFDGAWSHHLSQEDVDALLSAGRLRDFTHTWSDETRRLEKIEPPVKPTAEQVNEWSIRSMGHDRINAGVVIRARCEREGIDETCSTCKGHGSLERYEGQRAEAEAWEQTGPPEGDGWQLWETVSEGSPISPVFATADELAGWMSDPARGDRWVPPATAAKFVADGWAPSFVGTPGTGLVSGVEWVGHHADDEK